MYNIFGRATKTSKEALKLSNLMPTCFNINPFERNIFLEKQHILILINKEYTLKLWTNHNYVSSSMLWRVIEFSILTKYQLSSHFCDLPTDQISLHATLVAISAQDPNSETLFLSSENLNSLGKESFKGGLLNQTYLRKERIYCCHFFPFFRASKQQIFFWFYFPIFAN